MAKEVGGNENLGFTHEDMKNKLYSKRSLKIKQGDTGGLMEYLERKKIRRWEVFLFHSG